MAADLALMNLSHWHRSRGDSVTLARQIERGLFEPAYGNAYASTIFGFSQDRLMRFRRQCAEAIVGGAVWRRAPARATRVFFLNAAKREA